MAGYKVLGVAAASGRIGYAFIDNQRLIDWGMSKLASTTPERTKEKVGSWIDLLRPEVVVSERREGTRKRGRTLTLFAAIEDAAREADVIGTTIHRVRFHKNKYDEAAALAERFPELKPRLPERPPIWLPEPPGMIVFEALALALSVRLSETE